jgi:hypothetical protein
MTMATTVQTAKAPGMGTLINALSVDTAAMLPPPPARILVAVPRPRAFARLLAASAVVLIAAIAGLMLFLVHAVSDLLGGIVAHESTLVAPVVSALPPPEGLIDDAAFSASLAAFPGEAARLHLARARGFSAAGRFEAAAASYARARQLAINRLPAADLLAEATALAEGGRHGEALSEVLSLDFSAMAPAVRAQAVALIGRCHLAERAASRAAGEPSGLRLP